MSKPKSPLQRVISAYVAMSDDEKAQVLDVLKSIYSPPAAKARKRVSKPPVHEATPLGAKRGRPRKVQVDNLPTEVQ